MNHAQAQLFNSNPVLTVGSSANSYLPLVTYSALQVGPISSEAIHKSIYGHFGGRKHKAEFSTVRKWNQILPEIRSGYEFKVGEFKSMLSPLLMH